MIKKRQLFIALDADGKKVHVDEVDKESRMGFRCPYCKDSVLPKMGEKNVWHFAHRGAPCGYLLLKVPDGSVDGKLDFSGEKKIDLDSVDIGGECEKFLCVKCKKRSNKESGHRWKGNEFICPECFLNM